MMGFQPCPPTSGHSLGLPWAGSVMWGQCSQVSPDAGDPLRTGKGLRQRAGDLSQLHHHVSL